MNSSGLLSGLQNKGYALAGILLLTTSATTHAQSTYDKSIKAAQILAPLGLDAGGETVNYFTGTTTFRATDLAISGNNDLPVSVGRIYAVEPERMIRQSGGPHEVYSTTYDRSHLFGDWDLDIPHIAGTFGGQWQLDSTTPLNRCSVIGQIDSSGNPATGLPQNSAFHSADEFFHGYTLHTDAGSDVLLLASEPGAVRPASGGPYHWTTPKNWWVSCLPAIQNGDGEGFLAVSPSGIKYYFDWMSERTVGVLSELVDLGDEKFRYMNTYLSEKRMLPTRVVDRFGNWVQYQYSGDPFARLLSITSSDGRSISLQYDGLGHVTQITGGAVTVSYSYQSVFDGRSLKTVTMADGSTWDYNFAQTFYMQILPASNVGQENDLCSQPYPPWGAHPSLESYECVGWPQMQMVDPDRTITVKTPSNAFVQYVFNLHYQLVGTGGYASNYPIGLARKTISGPGMPPFTWQYGFGPDVVATKSQCLAGTCPTTVWTDELGPDNAIIRRGFGLQQTLDQGLMTSESHGTMVQGAPAFSKTTEYAYHIGQAVGHHPGGSVNQNYVLFTERRLPVQLKKVTQDQRIFKREVLAWDSMDREISVRSASTN